MIETTGRSIGKKFSTIDQRGRLGNGPGAYNANTARNHNIRYSMGTKLDDIIAKHKRSLPGPGNYDIRAYNSTADIKFGTSDRGSLEGFAKSKGAEPGPGHYKSEMNLASLRHRHEPAYSMGKGARGKWEDRAKPGPGQYASHSLLGLGNNGKSMASLSKYDAHHKESALKPGPGTHSPNKETVMRR